MLLEIQENESIAYCPYCGNDFENQFYMCLNIGHNEEWNLQCKKCLAKSPVANTRAEAIEKHNKRYVYYSSIAYKHTCQCDLKNNFGHEFECALYTKPC
jgi:hypothetical protein